jgi:hypothetical protein
MHAQKLINIAIKCFRNSHFFEKMEISVGKCDPLCFAQCGARVEKVDSQVRVVSFHRLADVLKRRKIND